MALHYGLDGRTAVITGAAGGIGRALSAAFAAQHAHVVLVDREPQALAALAQSLQGATEVTSVLCDLSNDAQVQALADQLAIRQLTVHALVNNAGSEYPTPLADAAPDAMARALSNERPQTRTVRIGRTAQCAAVM